MTDSEAAHMVVQLRQAWPDEPLSSDDEREFAKLFGHFRVDTVAVVMSDRLVADLPRPERAEMSRLLRVYANEVPKDPMPPPNRPKTAWAKDLPALPTLVPDFAERMNELRTRIGDGTLAKRAPEPFDPELKVVPDFVRKAIAAGREQRAVVGRDESNERNR